MQRGNRQAFEHYLQGTLPVALLSSTTYRWYRYLFCETAPIQNVKQFSCLFLVSFTHPYGKRSIPFSCCNTTTYFLLPHCILVRMPFENNFRYHLATCYLLPVRSQESFFTCCHCSYLTNGMVNLFSFCGYYLCTILLTNMCP